MSNTPNGSPELSQEESSFLAACSLIAPQLAQVEERIYNQAKQFDPAVEGFMHYICAAGGKRLRPMLTLLSAGATGSISSSHLDLAVTLELIHIASLIHDDIMDGADVRREQPTANAKWGNAITVLLGDALFAHALRLATNFENSSVCRRIANASVDVCSGEIIQTQHRFDLQLNIPDYFKIIEMKTAALFSAACELGASLNNAAPEIVTALQTFGRNVGCAYQIYDDCVDLVGSEEDAGKTLGTDLSKGKFTLPVLILLQESQNQLRKNVEALVLQDEAGNAGKLAALLQSEGSLQMSVETGKRILEDANAALKLVPESNFSQGLAAISAHIGKLFQDILHE